MGLDGREGLCFLIAPQTVLLGSHGDMLHALRLAMLASTRMLQEQLFRLKFVVDNAWRLHCLLSSHSHSHPWQKFLLWPASVL